MTQATSDRGVQVLLLEDVLSDAELVRQALEKAGLPAIIRQVDQKEEYVRALEELRPDIILADHALPEFQHAEALKLARLRYPDVPFIFVSGAVGEERAVEAIREGATDYVLKDHLMRLGPAVRRALEESRQRREKLRSEETLRLILENALDAVATMDSRGMVTAWNTQAERMFGWSSEEVLGRPLAEFIIPERLRAAHGKGMECYRATGEGPILGRRVEMPALHRDGHEFPVELTVTPIVQEEGTWFSAFIRDISGAKRMNALITVEHAVARILASAATADAALAGILEAMGRGLELDLANFWRLDRDLQSLVLGDSWSSDPAALAGFIDVSRNTILVRGKGLPGRVWASGAATWIASLTAEDILPRASQAAAAGLRGAFAFPIRDGQEMLGVLEVYSRLEIPPDPDLLEVLSALGNQIGQFLKRKRGEEAIRATEEQLRLITNALPSLIAYVDQHLRYSFVNRAYESWFGRTPGEIQGKTVWEVLGDEVYETIRPWLDRALAGVRVTYEARLPFKDGGPRWVEASYVPDLGPDGRVAGLFALVTDITPRKEAEESTAFLSEATRLLASSLDYETTLANIARLAVPRIADWSAICFRTDGELKPLAIIHRDPSKVAAVKEAMRRFPVDPNLPYGYAKVMRTGEPDLISEVTEDLLKAVAQSPEHLALLRDIGLRSVMTVPMNVAGKTVATLTLASSESGRRYGWEDLQFAQELARRAAMAIENSRLYREVRHESEERKRALEAVRDLNDHLERRVLERTAKLEEITRELDAFASTVAHDLRAPLRVMKGFSEMLLEDYSGRVLDPAGQEYARKIDRASERMAGLVEDLLAYSRLSRQDVPIHALDLGVAVDEVLQNMADELLGAGAELSVEKPLPRVLAHGALLTQVLANLISNAVKFVVPKAVPRVTIRAEREGSGVVRLWIEDNGIGIEPQHLDRIFGVFERLHTQDRYPGSGLGLAIVRRAVERMGGSVGVESVFGQGSRFWIRFRAAEEEEASHSGM